MNLNDYVDKLVGIENEIDELKADAKELVAAAKEAGFAPRALKQVVKERRLDAEGRARIKAHEMNVANYRDDLGLFSDTPLGAFGTLARMGAKVTVNGDGTPELEVPA